MTGAGQGGTGLVGMLAGLAGLFLLAGIAAGALGATRRQRAVEAAAHHLAAQMRAAAVRAVTSGRDAGLSFAPIGPGEPVALIADRDGDGLERHERVSAPYRLSRSFPGARVARIPWEDVAGLPPAGRRLRRRDPPVRFGPGRIATFSAAGHARAGHVTISDGVGALCAVVVTGPSARVRVLCYERGEDRWRER